MHAEERAVSDEPVIAVLDLGEHAQSHGIIDIEMLSEGSRDDDVLDIVDGDPDFIDQGLAGCEDRSFGFHEVIDIGLGKIDAVRDHETPICEVFAHFVCNELSFLIDPLVLEQSGYRIDETASADPQRFRFSDGM